MNKELIKKYKKEFDYWVNDGTLLVADSYEKRWITLTKNVWLCETTKNLLIIIDIINKHLKHQHLSQDEFKVMTLDEIKEYMQSVISDITSFSPDELYDTIIILEDIAANSHYDNVIK